MAAKRVAANPAKAAAGQTAQAANPQFGDVMQNQNRQGFPNTKPIAFMGPPNTPPTGPPNTQPLQWQPVPPGPYSQPHPGFVGPPNQTPPPGPPNRQPLNLAQLIGGMAQPGMQSTRQYGPMQSIFDRPHTLGPESTSYLSQIMQQGGTGQQPPGPYSQPRPGFVGPPSTTGRPPGFVGPPNQMPFGVSGQGK